MLFNVISFMAQPIYMLCSSGTLPTRMIKYHSRRDGRRREQRNRTFEN